MNIVVDQYKYIISNPKINNPLSGVNIRLNLNDIEPNPTRETVIEDDNYINLINDKIEKIKEYLSDRYINSIPKQMSLLEINDFNVNHVYFFDTTDAYYIDILYVNGTNVNDYKYNKHPTLNENICRDLITNNHPYKNVKVINRNKIHNLRGVRDCNLFQGNAKYIIYDGVINRNIKSFIQNYYLKKSIDISRLLFIERNTFHPNYDSYYKLGLFDIIEKELFITWADIENAYEAYKANLKAENKAIPTFKTSKIKLADGIIQITKCYDYSKKMNSTHNINLKDLYKYNKRIIYTNENLDKLYSMERLFYRFQIKNHIFVYVNKTTYKTIKNLKNEKLINIDDVELFNNPSFKKVVTKSIVKHHLSKYKIHNGYKEFIKKYISEEIIDIYEELNHYASSIGDITNLECYKDIIKLADSIQVVDQDYLNKCTQLLPILSKLQKIELLFISGKDYLNNPTYHTETDVLNVAIEICRYLGIKYKWDKSIYKFIEEPVKTDLITEIIE